MNQEKIMRSILINMFWIIVTVMLLIFSNPGNFLGVIFVLIILSNGYNLYHHIEEYVHFDSNKRQREHEKAMNDFKQRVDDWTRKINEEKNRQQQYRQAPIKKTELTVQQAYKLLQLKLTDDIPTVKKRYRYLAMQWHPDKFATYEVEKQEAAKRNFQRVNNAYNIIKKHKNFV
jgi:hypothetical protein